MYGGDDLLMVNVGWRSGAPVRPVFAIVRGEARRCLQHLAQHETTSDVSALHVMRMARLRSTESRGVLCWEQMRCVTAT